MGNIPFNKVWFTGCEEKYINECIAAGKTCGNGHFTKLCQDYFEHTLGSKKCLMTTSCTDALEMCALLADIGPGDEVIVPSYTFVSSALAFSRQGATVVFADSCADSPNIDPEKIESLITPRTKAIVPVHYAGIACDMDRIMDIAARHNLIVIEDAAQGIDSFYDGKPLGSIGHLAAFSFHETKNVQCGEGGLLAINDDRFVKRAEMLWEKGTNRAEFFRGEVNKYGWVDTGSSFLPAEYVSAFLWAQIENIKDIQDARKSHWDAYYEGLKDVSRIQLPMLPEYATNNGHAFFIICRSLAERSALIAFLKERGISSVFHYLSLHKSVYAQKQGWDKACLPEADKYTDRLLRLPMFKALQPQDIERVVNAVKEFYHENP
ncbi:dTDP-4-amino-4,6-dideoxygalactose transaminase [uncultured Muribaculum sp.]|uniref:dTDP-4-amino-4,6-dideoxygalactose transaminase n=1 Tax=uncultured Muribaculum sp. TaxID=1918613 RepID=UPI00259A0BA9|nr:dTDP-4-amino-4,6-dideoxygalactose transaminase [uncultured Muribaculum sp.]